MLICVVCKASDCEIIHSYEEISALTRGQNCCACWDIDCKKEHTIEELHAGRSYTQEQAETALGICIAYAKLCAYRDSLSGDSFTLMYETKDG